jgi:LysR family transcriptional regulator, low CO2-responsive transcriptional regulator
VQGFPLKRSWYIVEPQGKKLSVVATAFHDYLLASRLKVRAKSGASAVGRKRA